MIKDVRRKYFEIWADEQAQNVILRYLLLVVVVLASIQSVAFTVVVIRRPTLIGINESKSEVLVVRPPSDELLRKELERVLRNFVDAHYTWAPETIEKCFEGAEKYVIAANQKGFRLANSEQVRVAKERKISQRSHVVRIQVDAKALAARIVFDRILMVDGLNAITQITLDLKFEYGARTEANPEGVYISSEKLVE